MMCTMQHRVLTECVSGTNALAARSSPNSANWWQTVALSFSDLLLALWPSFMAAMRLAAAMAAMAPACIAAAAAAKPHLLLVLGDVSEFWG